MDRKECVDGRKWLTWERVRGMAAFALQDGAVAAVAVQRHIGRVVVPGTVGLVIDGPAKKEKTSR
jgi:hypothetical protein